METAAKHAVSAMGYINTAIVFLRKAAIAIPEEGNEEIVDKLVDIAHGLGDTRADIAQIIHWEMKEEIPRDEQGLPL